jgi:hypothetical protein
VNATLRMLTWDERAEHYDRLASLYRKAGNLRDAEFAETNAKSMRLCAAEGVPLDG